MLRLKKLSLAVLAGTVALSLAAPAAALAATDPSASTGGVSASAPEPDVSSEEAVDEFADALEESFEEITFVTIDGKEYMDISALEGAPQGEASLIPLDPQPQSAQVLKNGATTDAASLAAWDWNKFGNCVGAKVASAFMINELKVMFKPEVVRALKSRQWRVASSIIHTNLTKVLGKNVASKILKRIAAKALPGGLPGQIAIGAAHCGLKQWF